MSERTKRKLRGLMRSRTHWANAAFAFLVAAHPYLAKMAEIELGPSAYMAFAALMYGLLNWLRWVTDKPLEQK